MGKKAPTEHQLLIRESASLIKNANALAKKVRAPVTVDESEELMRMAQALSEIRGKLSDHTDKLDKTAGIGFK